MVRSSIHPIRDPDLNKSSGRKYSDKASISRELADRLKLSVGNHLRVDKPPYSTHYRIQKIHEESKKPILIHEDYLYRLGVRKGDVEVEVSTIIPQEHLGEARENGGLCETLKDDGVQSNLLITAPHAGDVESGTGDIAAQTYELFRENDIQVSLWMLQGFKSDEQESTSYRTWRIGKPMNSVGGYPGLQQIVDREFDIVVGVHRSGYDHIEVGGRMNKTVRQRVGKSLAEATERPTRTDIAELNLPGTHPTVSVNYLSDDANEGLYLELPPGVCDDLQTEVAYSVYTSLLETTDLD